jgi:hypothetical protein
MLKWIQLMKLTNLKSGAFTNPSNQYDGLMVALVGTYEYSHKIMFIIECYVA